MVPGVKRYAVNLDYALLLPLGAIHSLYVAKRGALSVELKAIVVEGKYDAIRLDSVIDATIVTTDGFGIFKHPETVTMLRRLAETQGIVVLTDSDGAGFVIRNRIAGAVQTGRVLHAYAPEIVGKERRKSAPSKEGLLGVEGIDGKRLLQALIRAGATVDDRPAEKPTPYLTKARLYSDGLSGGTDSAALREALLSALGLPRHLSANRLMQVVGTLLDEETYCTMLAHIKGENGE